jgi:hypothetical protein
MVHHVAPEQRLLSPGTEADACIKRQFWDLGDGSIAYAVDSYCGHIASSIAFSNGVDMMLL